MGIIVKGRAHLTGGVATSAAEAIRTALAQAATAGSTEQLPAHGYPRYQSKIAQQSLSAAESITISHASSSGGAPAASTPDSGADSESPVPADEQAILTDIATTLEQMDVLSGPLDGFLDYLRGGYPGDGKSAPPAGKPRAQHILPSASRLPAHSSSASGRCLRPVRGLGGLQRHQGRGSLEDP